MMSRKLLAVPFLLAVPMLAQPSLGEAPQRVAVRYRASDLLQPQGAEALYARIRTAAREACRADEGRSAAQHLAWQACRREATDRAVAALGSPAVAELHAARSAHGSSRAG
jgi:UrcA family protein